MAEQYFCWRCNCEMPFLDDSEWSQIEPLLGGAAKAIKQYRELHGCDLKTARIECKPEVTQKFFELTGVADVHFDAIWHHRRANWGPECDVCQHLLRTPNASHCVNCGENRPTP